MSEPCGCMIEHSKLVHICDIHASRDKRIKSITSIYLEAKIKSIFKPTFLHELREEILIEVRKLR